MLTSLFLTAIHTLYGHTTAKVNADRSLLMSADPMASATLQNAIQPSQPSLQVVRGRSVQSRVLARKGPPNTDESVSELV